MAPSPSEPVRLLYTETQRFSQWWLWACLGLADILLLSLVLRAFADQADPPTRGISLVALLFLAALTLLALVLRMDTKVDTEGVASRWRPLQRRFRKILWTDITAAEVIRYRFGRLGIHRSPRFGEVQRMGGSQGLLLTLANGRKLLLGTREPERLAALLDRVLLR